MAEQTPPTFKLVLVGDGGTGKVSWILSPGASIAGQGRHHPDSDSHRHPMAAVTASLLPSHPLPRDCQQE